MFFATTRTNHLSFSFFIIGEKGIVLSSNFLLIFSVYCGPREFDPPVVYLLEALSAMTYIFETFLNSFQKLRRISQNAHSPKKNIKLLGIFLENLSICPYQPKINSFFTDRSVYFSIPVFNHIQTMPLYSLSRN